MAEQRWDKTAASNFNERRNSGRGSFIVNAALVDLNSNSRLAARSADINRGGCYIDTLNPLPAGTTVTLRLTKENLSFRANAEVVYVQIGNGMGLAFTAAEAEQMRILDQWIAGLDAAMAPNAPNSELSRASQPETASHQSQQPTGTAAYEQQEPGSLTYLILMLVQKNILSEIEGQALLEKIGA
jgi:hypothetical protein